MITLDLSILNQKGTPMFNSDLFANRPAAGIVGRIFISTDTQTIFRDTGTTWDTIGGGGGTIAGSIATGQVAFGTAANTIGGSNIFTWDNTNRTLLLSGAQIYQNINQTNTTLDSAFTFLENNVIKGGIQYLGSAFSVVNRRELIEIVGRAGISFRINSEFGRFSNVGNLLLNSTTDNGQRLQVYGDTLLRGTGNTSATTALTVQNSDSTNLFYVQNNGFTYNRSRFYIGGPTTTNSIRPAGTLNREGFEFASSCFGTDTTPDFRYVSGQGIATTITSGSKFTFSVETPGFAPTSGTATYNLVNLSTTINQTDGANGITRGLYVNPALTAAADWRSIEWSNNSGWGLYGDGGASNFLSGNLLIGNATPIASNIGLQVTGLGYIKDSRAYASGTIQSFVIVRDTTINTAISASSGICNYVSTGDSTIQSSQSVPASTSFAGIYTFNKYAFASAGLTLTATQAAGNGLRSVSQLQTQNVFKGTNSGTITHVSGIQIAGFYNESDTIITPVIPNAYQLIINDTGAYGHTFTFTNRWGIYQEGINDRNYLAGNLLLNSTVDTGQILQVNGAIRVNGQASATAGGSSGNHLIINLDGTQYKIALLNP